VNNYAFYSIALPAGSGAALAFIGLGAGRGKMSRRFRPRSMLLSPGLKLAELDSRRESTVPWGATLDGF